MAADYLCATELTMRHAPRRRRFYSEVDGLEGCGKGGKRDRNEQSENPELHLHKWGLQISSFELSEEILLGGGLVDRVGELHKQEEPSYLCFPILFFFSSMQKPINIGTMNYCRSKGGNRGALDA